MIEVSVQQIAKAFQPTKRPTLEIWQPLCQAAHRSKTMMMMMIVHDIAFTHADQSLFYSVLPLKSRVACTDHVSQVRVWACACSCCLAIKPAGPKP